jgi:predicted TIM-barrel fold metal-dependent hydrolase
MGQTGSERYTLISTDGHCGAALLDYKPYLEKRFHEEFDAWAATYHDAWGDVDDAYPIESKLGYASFGAPLNWESQARLAYTENQGIVAEVLFPNTSPPFFPSGAITAPGPRTEAEYDYRWAGLKAHNRWLADFCNDAPGRRAGMAQVFLDNLDDAIAEVRWAKGAGLMGVLLPADHVQKLVGLYYPNLEPLWAACEELQLPVHRHAIKGCESPEEGGLTAAVVYSFENEFYMTRPISHLILAGVFDRHPDLKFVITEIRAGHIDDYLDRLDKVGLDAHRQATSGPVLGALKMKPSEYFATNCYVGGPFDIRASYDAGVPNLMWGADVPHAEGTSPHTTAAIRHELPGIPEPEIRQMLQDRAVSVYGFDMTILKPLGDRVGPFIDDISRPLTPDETPEFQIETRCPVFNHAPVTL